MTEKSSQINIIKPELFQACVDSSRYVGDIHHFGRDEQLLARKPTLMNGLTQVFFRSIDFGPVKMVIAQFHCVLHRIDQLTIDACLLRGLKPCSAGAIPKLCGDESHTETRNFQREKALTTGMVDSSLSLTVGISWALVMVEN